MNYLEIGLHLLSIPLGVSEQVVVWNRDPVDLVESQDRKTEQVDQVHQRDHHHNWLHEMIPA